MSQGDFFAIDGLHPNMPRLDGTAIRVHHATHYDILLVAGLALSASYGYSCSAIGSERRVETRPTLKK